MNPPVSYNPSGDPRVNSISTIDVLSFVEDGRRAYRLKRSINSCPNFDIEVYKQAWIAGWSMTRDGLIGREYDRAWIKSLDGANVLE